MSAPAAERGSLTITHRALTHLSEHAARESVERWKGPGRRARVVLSRTRGIARARVEVPYPYPAADAAEEVGGHVAGRLETLADTRIRRVEVIVAYGAPAGQVEAAEYEVLADDRAPEAEPGGSSAFSEPVRRLGPLPGPSALPDSESVAVTRPLPHARTLPATLAACAIGVVSALALTVAIQRRHDHRGVVVSWAKAIANATPEDAAVTAAAIVLLLLGLLCLAYALLPARRALPMATPGPQVHATITTRSVASHLRHLVRELDRAPVVKVRRFGAGAARVRIAVPESAVGAARTHVQEIVAAAPESLAVPAFQVRTIVDARKDTLR